MNKTNFKKVVATVSGNIIEFYDFIIFAFLSKYISQTFFIAEDKILGMIYTFGVFASGFIARPIGAIFFGYIGDKHGRKKSLLISILLVSVSTFAIGVLPSVHQVGVIAPVLLVVCRLIQGFAVSGEEGGAAVFLIESFKFNRKGLYGSLILSSAYLGVLLGSFACLVLSHLFTESQIADKLWRLPFLIASVLGIWAYLLRRGVDDSVRVDEAKSDQKGPIKSLATKKMLLFTQTLMAAALSISVYMLTLFIPNYMSDIYQLSMQETFKLSIIGLIMLVICVPISGIISDMIGENRVFLLGCASLIILSYPIFVMFSLDKYIYALQANILLAFCVSLIAGPIFALLIQGHSAHVRFSAVSITFNMSMTIFGSTTPMLSYMLIKYIGANNSPFVLLALSGILGFTGYCLTVKKINGSVFRNKESVNDRIFKVA